MTASSICPRGTERSENKYRTFRGSRGSDNEEYGLLESDIMQPVSSLKGTYCLHFQGPCPFLLSLYTFFCVIYSSNLKTDAVSLSKPLVHFYQAAWCYITKGSVFH